MLGEPTGALIFDGHRPHSEESGPATPGAPAHRHVGPVPTWARWRRSPRSPSVRASPPGATPVGRPLRVRPPRPVSARGLDRVGSLPLCELPLGVAWNHLVVLGDQIP